jgi:hypothetical protein
MYNWLEQDLLATDAEWVVAFWHHPPYTKGSHNSDVEFELRQMRQNFLPLLEAHGVDLVLSGHSHSYERSFLLDGHYGVSGTFVPSMKIDGGDGRPAGGGAYNKLDGPHRGAVYCVAGSSGKTGGGPLNHPAMVHSISALGSLVLDVDRGRMDVKFLRSTGEVWDSFTLLSQQWFGAYCAPAPHQQGCVTTIGWTGTPSASAHQPFLIEASSAFSNQNGLLFYGFVPANLPLSGSRRCVGGRLKRTPVQSSGGSNLACSGTYSFDFNATIQSGADPDLVPGKTVYSQYWFRNPGSATGAGTSEALQFTIEP